MGEVKENVHAGHRQRVRKRFIEHGFDGMEPHQILEMFLFYAVPRKDTNQLAHQLLDRYGSIAGVCDAPIDVLQSDFGLSENAAVLMKMLPKLLGVYMETSWDIKNINLHTASKVLRPKFIGATEEQVVLALGNAREKLLFCDVVSRGSLTSTDFPVRKIVDFALRHNARYAFVAHNHPSGLPLPSQADLDCTHTLSRMLNDIGVLLVDHIIFADEEFMSLRGHKRFSAAFVK